jgi:hypothetical protein
MIWVGVIVSLALGCPHATRVRWVASLGVSLSVPLRGPHLPQEGIYLGDFKSS